MTGSWLFKLRGDLNKYQKLLLAILGLIFFIIVWVLLTMGNKPILPANVFPYPLRVLNAFNELYYDRNFIINLCKSIGFNLGGYIKAILYAIPVGFMIGLIPLLRGAFQRMVDAIRFLPLTALTGLFIIWYGVNAEQKINFLSFGIFIYLLPIVIQRIDEVDDVYLKTVHTLGAGYWQTIKTVYFPSVISRLSDDIRILTAVSWTYIIVAETNGEEGGIGTVILAAQRLVRVDIIIACLIIIILIGIFQDWAFSYLDRKFFPFKYQVRDSYEGNVTLKRVSGLDAIFDYVFLLLTWIFLALYLLFMFNEWMPFLGVKPLSYLFGDVLWTIHFIFILILIYQFYHLYQKIFIKS
jgi:NitT/TauT family transport system permease protein